MSKKKEETKPETKPDLAGDIVRVVLSHGDTQELRLTEALGSLAFAGLELYSASKLSVQKPEQPEGDGKTEGA